MPDGRVVCPYCDYVWEPRAKQPVSCPLCHRYFRDMVDWSKTVPETARACSTYEEFVEKLASQERFPDTISSILKQLLKVFREERDGKT